MAAKIAVKYGGFVNSIFTEERVKNEWGSKDYPSHLHVENIVRIPKLKWYIRNKIKITDPIWNADFIHGLVSFGAVKWNTKSFPTVTWEGNERLTEIIKECPYGGDLNEIAKNPVANKKKRWVKVPALYLAHDVKSISFMAGVMASGEMVEINNAFYAKYNIRQIKHFKEWGIPIEYERKPFFMVSPIWPALLSVYMPDICSSYFIVPKAHMAKTYAPILWRTYFKKSFVSKGIPYLKSRRQIYYDHSCEEGIGRKLEMLRLKLNLVSLDNRIKQAVRKWAEKNT